MVTNLPDISCVMKVLLDTSSDGVDIVSTVHYYIVRMCDNIGDV